MTNNTQSKRISAIPPHPARQTLAQAHRRAGSYRQLAEDLGIKHHNVISNFVKHGKIPKSKKDKIALGIYEPSKGKKKYDQSNIRARAKGWDSWNEYQLAINAGQIELPTKNEFLIMLDLLTKPYVDPEEQE